ncbi:type II toxin-antitoxin system RelE/ParE family toxin [Methylocapsa sp. S129]|uniref:type II toxin-antitoxin system RelE/ParE family toxin n=1 Tax=Methylocapsa sp. S129 TaxID=1641869 RepID=UPI00131B495C|nr:type II toxin-antitoxin system RelE/ParE family toxin [Methylocapsa sp. S129]
MSGFVFSPRAQADIEEIWDYTAARWNTRQAEAYIRQIQAAIETVAAAPKLARSCEEIKAGYWKYPAGSHVIFFRLIHDGIDIVRVLHGRMDFERHL